MIEGIQIESDEGGFMLVVAGDFVDAADEYLSRGDVSELRLRLPQDAALRLLAEAEREIRPWRTEMEAARAEYDRTRDVPDDAEGYDLDDPKSPGYYERMADAADLSRKRPD